MTTKDTADAGRVASVVLTVADREQNGFVALARWPALKLDEARGLIEAIDATISDDAEPDIETAAFTFILDLWDGDYTIDNGKRLLPTQVAMSLAPEQVQHWLNERPSPDSVICRRVPTLARAALSSSCAEVGK